MSEYLLNITVFALITAVVLTLRWWLRRRGRLPLVRWWVKLIGLLVLHGGVALSVWSLGRIERDLRLLSRPTVRACIVDGEVVGGRNYQPRITYRYLVDGVEYTGTSDLHAPGFGGKWKRYDAAKVLLEAYPPGDFIYVVYNPLEPSDSSFTPTPAWNLYVQLATGWLLFTLGLIGAVLPVRPKA